MYKAWWATQLQVNAFVGQLQEIQEIREVSARAFKLSQVPADQVTVLVDRSVFELRDPREQIQISHGLVGEKTVWLLRKVPLHRAKELPLATYVDVGNNMIRVFEEVSEFTRRY